MREQIRKLIWPLSCLIAGLFATVIVAVLCVLFAPVPNLYSRGVDQYILTRYNLTSQRNEYNGDSCAGLGYQFFDIRQYDFDAPRGPSKPILRSQLFITEFGWPQLALVTDSPHVGTRLGLSSNHLNAAPTRIFHAFPIRILWSGLVFDWLFFGLLCAVLSWPLRPKACLGGRHAFGIVVICLSFWMSLFAAWGFDLARQELVFLPRHYQVFNDLGTFETNVQQLDLPLDVAWESFLATVNLSLGYQEWRASLSKGKENGGQTNIAAERGVALGWPAFSIRGDYFGSWSDAANNPFPSEARMSHLFQLMALPVWWPGFLINWFLYALLLIAAVRGPGMIRRFVRVRRNRCVACGYPRGTSAVCSECGADSGLNLPKFGRH